MLYAGSSQHRYGIRDWMLVMWHGLPIDLSVAAYLTLFPVVILLVGVWLQSFPVKRFIQVYDLLTALLLSAIFVGDTALYPFWGFKLDASVLFYLKTPKEAMASVSVLMVVVGVILILLVAWLIYRILMSAVRPVKVPFNKVLMRVPVSLFLLILFAPLFLAIRGGVSESTMNVGHAYFSADQFLNHSAVNPSFSMLSSMSKTSDYSSWYDYLDEDNRSAYFDGLYTTSDSCTESLLNTDRPNILVIVLEGFGGDFVNAMSGKPDVSPRLDSLIKEGVFFSNCYAGSFRTDRGLVCVMNGHPGLPKTSIMKLPSKSAALPSLPCKLLDEGYETYFMYGGDINFTNMKSWLYGTGFRNVVSDADFSIAERHTNAWGVNDDITFSRLLEEVKSRKDSLWFTGFLSLSSHEPFEVPYNRLEDKVDNAFAYTDSCLGAFVDGLKQSPVWDNLLVMILPDHGFRYTKSGLSSDPHVHHIPVLWVGGAVREPRIIDRFTGQSDMAATILGQLGIDHCDFLFSRNVLSCSYSYPFSFYTYNNGFCFMDSTGVTLYDDDASACLINDSYGSDVRLNRGKAIVQTLHDDLGSR
ncbi:MAG: LTA synthase family protein [Bacteroidaceae bacterium]|nr:LTA synthase family protein [Bacteroidaceae bacterium]